ncbi:MAG: DNA alkylation repair protein [Acholeplasmataceae bacterium]
MTLDNVKKTIYAKQNLKRIAFDQKLNPNQTIFNGLTIPQMREIAKDIYQDNPYIFLDNNDFSSYELEQIHAMVICMLKDIDIALKYFKNFIPHIHGWAVNDTLCNHFKLARKNREKVFLFLKNYLDSDQEFEQRVVAVMLLSHYLTDDYIDQVIVILDHLKINAYYSKMAVAWAFATILAKYPDKGLSYMKHHHLDDWTFRKTIQKAIESFRVTDELKETLKLMR